MFLAMQHREAPIVLYTIYGCPHCQNAMKFVKRHNLPHKAINIGNDAQKMVKLAQSTGSPTVPKIFVQGQFVGGYSELIAMGESGELGHRLSQPQLYPALSPRRDGLAVQKSRPGHDLRRTAEEFQRRIVPQGAWGPGQVTQVHVY